MSSAVTLLVLANGVTFIAAGFITLLATRAYRRTGSPAMAALGFGMGMVTFGSFLAGVLYHVAAQELLIAIQVQSVFTAFGFLVLLYSLYTTHSVSIGPSANKGN